jgi:hypothetical protein
VFFTTAHATVVGYGATHVTVDAHGHTSWKVSHVFPGQDHLVCVLRGVA